MLGNTTKSKKGKKQKNIGKDMHPICMTMPMIDRYPIADPIIGATLMHTLLHVCAYVFFYTNCTYGPIKNQGKWDFP